MSEVTIEPIRSDEDRIDQWDELKGNDYTNLWTMEQREVSSNEFITNGGALARGRVVFDYPFKSGEVNVKYFYIQQLDNSGSLQSKTYNTINELAQAMNHNTPVIVHRDGKVWRFEFDNTEPVMSQQPEDWQGPDEFKPEEIGRTANIGFMRIGVVFVESKGWTKYPIHGSSEPYIHVPLPHTMDTANIEICLVAHDTTQVALGVFRRDLPIVDPNDHAQFILHGTALYQLKLISEIELEIRRQAGAGDVGVKEVWWRFI